MSGAIDGAADAPRRQQSQHEPCQPENTPHEPANPPSTGATGRGEGTDVVEGLTPGNSVNNTVRGPAARPALVSTFPVAAQGPISTSNSTPSPSSSISHHNDASSSSSGSPSSPLSTSTATYAQTEVVNRTNPHPSRPAPRSFPHNSQRPRNTQPAAPLPREPPASSAADLVPPPPAAGPSKARNSAFTIPSVQHRPLTPLAASSPRATDTARTAEPPNVPIPDRNPLNTDETFSSSTSYSPKTPTQETFIHRRRLSIPFPRVPPRRRLTITADRAETSLAAQQRSRVADDTSSSRLWGGLLGIPSVESRNRSNKSDDEREDDKASTAKRVRPTQSRKWWNMAGYQSSDRSSRGEGRAMVTASPPSANEAMAVAPLPLPNSLFPPTHPFQHPNAGLTITSLALDPHNILPLSLPGTPFDSPPMSRYGTPYHSPHPSIGDLHTEYSTTSMSAGPSGSSGSPRTSISTSSSRVGWQNAWSDSRSSNDEDESSPPSSARAWWFQGHHDGPISPKILLPPGPTLRSVRIPSATRFFTTGTRSWGWLLEFIGDSLGGSAEIRQIRRSRSMRKRNRERERLISGLAGRRLRNEPILGSKWLGRAWAFVPTSLWSICAFFVFAVLFVATVWLTLKHVLNPDKEALPYRQYCTAQYPTLYSLQDPNVRPPSFSDHAAEISASSNLYQPFVSRPANLVLQPLDPLHPAWPYSPHAKPPYSVESSELDEIAPVGVLIGVMTTDAGAHRRHMIRQSYASHWRSRRDGTEGVRIRFVMARPRKRFERAVQLEMEAFNDILLLDMPEHMNSGKTHAFFSWAAENATVPDWEYPRLRSDQLDRNIDRPGPYWKGERRPDYVVKADEDSFIMLSELERRLRATPRTKSYWGYLVKNSFMAGECYALSFDLVQYIATSPPLKIMTVGKEDKLVSKWIKLHPEREKITWSTDRCWMYDHPKAGTVYSHGFLFPSEVASVRSENATGLSPETLAIRGGPEVADTYSTVSKFGTTYRPLTKGMSAVKTVEALIEGSPISRLREEDQALATHNGQHLTPKAESMQQRISTLFDSRPSRRDRFLGREQERGGTVVIHYIKKDDWWIETMVALLGTADEQDGRHRGVGTGLGMLERREGKVIGSGHEGEIGEEGLMMAKNEDL